ncbi:MAG: type II secretion system F family protein [Coriobacteriia bacterium]|nr:type II secretion system F family protein [Coriobacteriia bacterium]
MVLILAAALATLAGALSFGMFARVMLEAFWPDLRLEGARAQEFGLPAVTVAPAWRAARLVKQRLVAVARRLAPQVFAWRQARGDLRRAERCARELPDMIDILTLGLQAGLSFDAALSAYIERFDTTLARELGHMQHSYQLGLCSRHQALQQLCDRVPDDAIMRFVTVVNEALDLGAPLLTTFGTLTFELRRYQKLKLEERIARAPVKLLVPLGLCVLPAVLILLMGPVLLQMIAGLHL